MRINSCSPETIDIKIVNGMFFLHPFADLPLIVGPLEKLILLKVSKQRGKLSCTEIHLITACNLYVLTS